MRNEWVGPVCHPKRGRSRHPGIALLVFFCVSFPVWAGNLSAQPATHLVHAGNVTVAAGGGVLFQPKAHVSGGGDIAVSSYMVRTGFQAPLDKKLDLGVDLSYEFEDYRFSNLSAFAVGDPWNKVHRVGLSGRLTWKASPRWSYFFSPVGQYAGEEGADTGKSFLYGGAAGVVYRKNRDFMIGFGIGGFYRLEETKAFPSIIVNWNITDRLHLMNPFRLGPAGPAGIELVYDVAKDWALGLGGGYRSFRFRLDANGPAPSGIGQISCVPVYLSLGRKFGRHISLYAYGGAAFAGSIRLEDRAGNRIDSVSYSTAPLLGLAFWATF